MTIITCVGDLVLQSVHQMDERSRQQHSVSRRMAEIHRRAGSCRHSSRRF